MPQPLPSFPRIRKSQRKGSSHLAINPELARTAASYARFSSDHQSEQSITDQQRNCREYAEREGLQIPSEFEFADSAVSGTLRDREALNRMEADAASGKFKTLLFFNLARLARESIIGLSLLKTLVLVHRVRVISTGEGIDSNRQGWESLAMLFSMQSDQFLATLSKSVFSGQEGTVYARFSVGDYRFGYSSKPSPGGEMTGRGRNAKPRMVYEVDLPQAEWVRRVFHWFANEHQTIAWICRQLNAARVPKDHRSTSPLWKHAQVISLLSSPKYVGMWPWGTQKNVREPLSGRVTQEARPEEETEKWWRDFPELRIIDDSVYHQAQLRLDEQERGYAGNRKSNGQLQGSPPKKSGNHLLAKLVECSHCGSLMQVGGVGGKYMLCPRHLSGQCPCKTQLPRQRAETLFLDAIGLHVLANSRWKEHVFVAAARSASELLHRLPAESIAIRKEIEELERSRGRLLKVLESQDNVDPSIHQRLSEISGQVRGLSLRQTELNDRAELVPDLPTREWVDSCLGNLGASLRSATPAAGMALRKLLDGPISVEEIPVEGKKRCYLRATMKIRLVGILTCIGGVVDPAAEADNQQEIIVIELRPETKIAAQSAAAWELYQNGMMMSQIAEHLKMDRSQATRTLRYAAKERGVVLIDGRQRRSTLKKRRWSRHFRRRFRMKSCSCGTNQLPLRKSRLDWA